MSSRVTVKVEGLSRLVGDLKAFEARVVAGIKKAVAKAAVRTQGLARRMCPVDTGRLRSSIAIDFYDGGLSAEVFTDVEYAAHVEFGTRFQRAQPFLGPAWDQTQPEFIGDVSAVLRSA